ncbi:glycosyltransferase family 39 protein [Sphingobium amiense]|nr:glycosyltransferase family 39 protein [Sphingobium amiense]
MTGAALLWASLLLWFVALALATPFDHDESQYVAGAMLSGRLTIFRDFLYLQPPLHAWAYAPLAWLFPSHVLTAMRLATAFSAIGALWLIRSAQRTAGISRDSATLALMLMASTAAFQFTAGVVRNDMLPTLLLAGGTMLSLRALKERRRDLWLVAGLCLGLAISAKLNFAPVGAAVGLFLLFGDRRTGFGDAGLLAAGAGFGLVPLLLAWAAAPEAFVYGVITYGATAPHAWYAANGAGDELALLGKTAQLLLALVKGPTLIALLLIGCDRFMTRDRPRSAERRLVLWMVAGALTGAALPTPAQLQYVMPLIPPLALALGHFLDDARDWNARRRHVLLGLLSAGVVPGMIAPIGDIAAMTSRGSPVLEAEAGAEWAGSVVRHETRGATVATLSPHMMAGSGLRLDPRFAAGPFAYRTGWTVPVTQARRLHIMTPQTLSDMDAAPPAAILTGYERGTRTLPLAVDAGLIAYARRRGYRAMAMPDGTGTLYVRIPADRSPLRREARPVQAR